MNHEKTIGLQRRRRRWRVGNKIRGTAERPRLTIYRSHKHIYAQVVNDEVGQTLCSASTLDAEVRSDLANGGNRDAATAIGKLIAEKALAAGVKEVAFDRGRCRYHGRVAALADAAREGGLGF
ncbi:MAG: 50S ribosomal protein L18 [Pirellulales bacterium]